MDTREAGRLGGLKKSEHKAAACRENGKSAGRTKTLLLGQPVWLQELSRVQRLTDYGLPRTKKYWTLPAYALAHKIKRQSFLSRFRKMEAIAKSLFQDRAPKSRTTKTLSEEQKQAIRARFLEVRDFHKVAEEFGIKAFRVGQLCQEEKPLVIAERDEALPAGTETPKAPTFSFEDPGDSGKIF